MSDDRANLDRDVSAGILAGDLRGVATRVLEAYGAEIFGFLAARLRHEETAREAFSRFTEDLWRGLPAFEGRSSVRVWAYTLARHAAIREGAAPHRRRERHLTLETGDPLARIEEKIRTETAPFLRTEFKTKVAELRAQLTEEERTLLVLRVDRGLEWEDVARVFLPPEPPPSKGLVKTEAARIRKRFQLVKAKIRRLAKEQGILEQT